MPWRCRACRARWCSPCPRTCWPSPAPRRSCPPPCPAPAIPAPADVARLAALLHGAQRPILLAGHAFDRPGARAALQAFAEAWSLPVAVSFRRQDLFPNGHALYAGDLGLRNPDAQRAAFAEADLVIALGTRLTDITTQGWTWPAQGQRLVHVCAEPRFLGWQFPAEMALAADAVALTSRRWPTRPPPPRRARRLEHAPARHPCCRLRGCPRSPDGIALLKVMLSEEDSNILLLSRTDPNAVYAGSVPYLMLAGNLVAGWRLGRALLVAERKQAAGEDAEFMRQKIAIARFYGDHVLTRVAGLRDSIVDGAGWVNAMAPEAF